MGRVHPAVDDAGSQVGQAATHALIYGRDGDRYLVVASNGGAVRHPAWYLNVLEHPEVEVQVAADTFYAIARPASQHEKPGLWRTMADLWPQYDRYQAKTRRDIPLVVIERSD